MSLNVYKCQPSLTSPCLSENQITSDGGQIVHQLDGSVSVWVKNDGELVPYTDINTKACCEYLGYTFDIENQKCLWEESSCDTCEIKIAIPLNEDDGEYFLVNDNSQCSLDINLDYLFKFDCSILKSGQTTNQEVINIQNQITELEKELTELIEESIGLSAQCTEYTSIYTAMCYTIEIKKELNNNFGDGLFSPFSTVCCLTEDGLERWNSILGDIKYQSWLDSNGCNTTIYSNQQALQLYNEGNNFAIENNSPNPYFNITDDGICDKQTAFLEKEEKCEAYNNIISEITDIQNEINDLLEQLNNLNNEGLLCDDPISNLERFTAYFSLDVETDTTNLYETIYEQQIFGIGEGNLMQYIISNSPNTGIVISGDTGILPPFGTETTCPYDDICKEYRDSFIRELYLNQYLLINNEPTSSLENKELLDLMGGWYNSPWINYTTTINDPDIIEKIKNKKIRISIKVDTCCLDFGLLLDKIKVTQTCENIENTLIKVAKPFGFDLTKVVDNKKSWVSNKNNEKRTYYLDWRNTEYNINDHRLSLNTKEIDLNIDPAKAIEGDVFKYLFNNPCSLDCISGETVVEFNTYVDFQSVLDTAIQDCANCITCYYQKQFENYECFDLMNGEPYEFEFQNGPPSGNTTCDILAVWSMRVSIDGEEVYNNPNFYSGNTSTSIPTQNEYLNELNNIANSLNLIFINNETTASFIDAFACDNYNYSGKSFKIDLDLSVSSCEAKNFEDGDCFDFMDGDLFQFEDQ